eukprot:gene12955-biopygen8204
MPPPSLLPPALPPAAVLLPPAWHPAVTLPPNYSANSFAQSPGVKAVHSFDARALPPPAAWPSTMPPQCTSCATGCSWQETDWLIRLYWFAPGN